MELPSLGAFPAIHPGVIPRPLKNSLLSLLVSGARKKKCESARE
jgi:hypothetical protein